MRRWFLLASFYVAAVIVTGATAAGFTRQQVAGLPVSVALPPLWQDIAVPATVTPSVVKRLVATDAAASVLSVPIFAQAGIRFIANERGLKGYFAANLNLIVKLLPPNLGLRAWFFSGASAAAQYVGTTTAISNYGTPGLHYQSTRVQKYGTVPLLTDVYAFAHNGRVYDFTYTSLATDASRYLPTFTASGRSVRFSTP